MKYNVSVIRDLNASYTYSYGQELDIGQLVSVDFRNKETIAIVLDKDGSKFSGKIKKISSILPYEIPKSYIQFAKFVSDYNIIKLGTIFKLIIPFSIDSILSPEKEIRKEKPIEKIPVMLSSSQNEAVIQIQKYEKQFKTILLHGITGSGKTEVFLEIARSKVENENKQILILVPEVSLSGELAKKVAMRLGCDVFIWHNSVSSAKKLKIWKKAINGDKMIIVGARSALFIPFSNLGLIVIDEEHDMSFKQSESAIYNARDMGIYLAFCTNIPVILSSATPSVESYNNATSGKYEYIKLNSRYFENATLPSIQINDLRKEKLSGILSEHSIKEINECLKLKKQALIFVNRRGHTPKILCRSCGAKVTCPSCSAWLCYHFDSNEYVCHYCDYKTSVKNTCELCGKSALSGIGVGIEKVYDECSSLFPNARIMMLSSDTINTPNKISKAIDQIKNNEVDIIIGTQIVAKGHNFDNLNLVIITCMDAMLYGEDFRSLEKAFQMLYQVSGRAGRIGDTNSKVVIQTYNPDNDLMQILQNNDIEKLYESEINNRKLTKMPPFGKMIGITISALSEREVEVYAKKLIRSMPRIPGVKILGPIQPNIYKLRSRYRLKILITSDKKLQDYIKGISLLFKIPNNIRIAIDVDPYDFG